MDSEAVETAVTGLRETVDEFLGELGRRGVYGDRLGEIVEDTAELEGSDLRQFPERFVEDYLIWPVLDALGYEITPRPHSPVGGEEEYPDFRVDNLPINVIGENKSLNDIDTAEKELLEYLDSARHDYGIATDGIEWGYMMFQKPMAEASSSIQSSSHRISSPSSST